MDFLFGKNKQQIDNEYASAIDDVNQQRADAGYNDYYNRQLFDANKDYFKSQGITNYNDAFGSYSDAIKPYEDTLSTLTNEREAAARHNKYNVAGNGLIGSLINPLVHTADIAGDMFSTGAKSAGNLVSGLTGGDWNKYGTAKELNRYTRDNSNDFLSDLGNLGEMGLNIATLGTGPAAKTALGTIGKDAAIGAGYGVTGTLSELGRDANIGDLAMSAGLGGAIGGGLAGLGYGAGKVWNKYSMPAPSKSTEVIPYSGINQTSGEYQNAINTLRNAGIDTTTEDTLNNTFKQFAKQNHPDVGGSAEEFTKVNNARNTYQDLLNNAGSQQRAQAYPSSKISFSDRIKNIKSNIPNIKSDFANTKAGRVLSTKAGKVGAGVGGGLLLAKLLSGNGNQNTVSDAEMQDLYNYIYGGGQ